MMSHLLLGMVFGSGLVLVHYGHNHFVEALAVVCKPVVIHTYIRVYALRTIGSHTVKINVKYFASYSLLGKTVCLICGVQWRYSNNPCKCALQSANIANSAGLLWQRAGYMYVNIYIIHVHSGLYQKNLYAKFNDFLH